MLNRLLSLLREGGTRHIRNLAVELDTTPELVQAMLGDLARMGYLRRVGAECSDKCTTCSLSGMCVAGGSSCEESNEQEVTAWVFAGKQRAE
jgi:DNA-binding Lrp family transcriptional regulator